MLLLVCLLLLISPAIYESNRHESDEKPSNDYYSSVINETINYEEIRRQNSNESYEKISYKHWYLAANNLREKKNENGHMGQGDHQPKKQVGEETASPTADTENLLIGCKFSRNPREYRTLDGTFNNPKYPARGASQTRVTRIFPPFFEDGFNVPRGTDPDRLYNGFPLPPPIKVTTEFLAKSFENDPKFTDIQLHFANLVAVDMQGSQFTGSCPEDPSRAVPVCGTGTGKKNPRFIQNFVTSYLDASANYGSDSDTGFRLRDPRNITMLRSGPTEYATSTGKPLLPLITNETSGISVCPQAQPEPQECFVSGLSFFNGSPQVVALVTIFFREHNRLAERLKELNPSWNGETVYQEARKIVGAIYQHIFYSEYLPTIFSDIDQILGPYRGYDPNVDASVFTGFASASRFHHMIKPIIELLGPDYKPIGDIPIGESVFASVSLILEHGLDAIIRSDVALPARKPSPLSLALKELRTPPFPDAFTADINRGRDRGWQTYNTWRRYCGLPSCDDQDFDCYKGEIKEESVRNKLENLYGSPNNVDLGMGGVAENPIDGEILGPTYKCIYIEQFMRLRDGDSFWYERKGVFSAEQLAEIKKVSLARIICDNSDAIKSVPKNVFLLSDPDTYLYCDSIDKINLDSWKEIDTCNV